VNIEATATRLAPYVLSIVRIVAALIFLEHGTAKLLGWPPSSMLTPALFSMYWFAGMIEIVGGILLALGLFTRCAAFIMSGETAFAYFLGHAPRSFFPLLNGGDASILYCRRRWAVEHRRMAAYAQCPKNRLRRDTVS
jgi:putative oxidoreductase